MVFEVHGMINFSNSVLSFGQSLDVFILWSRFEN